MVLHLECSVGEDGIHGPLDATDEVGLAVAVEIAGPGVGSVDGKWREGLAVEQEQARQVEDRFRR